ncbi:Hypothetical_protein [Hexamita inflata]|uniref:Hypothetical_protein n=1 Tax=Hexamita inflata TaxID=28002 RepID=A0AA86QBL5_9EUKA|nr:Hypothetical protein HINF_LOCUS43849 [Hexamita inflata]
MKSTMRVHEIQVKKQTPVRQSAMKQNQMENLLKTNLVREMKTEQNKFIKKQPLKQTSQTNQADKLFSNFQSFAQRAGTISLCFSEQSSSCEQVQIETSIEPQSSIIQTKQAPIRSGLRRNDTLTASMLKCICNLDAPKTKVQQTTKNNYELDREKLNQAIFQDKLNLQLQGPLFKKLQEWDKVNNSKLQEKLMFE